ncbi:hypothetical protein Pla163_10230 [Planctomycetes bacterium Pla163]|uniref:Uncharacterized protein n=1 Tax=Rohdeia mirabilis TaxID=2528008 RepID=A0A518CXG7_9BACT|nr:hypothetical protein Pla163_10230 [Planctomycetes bacterium Pla163]
MLRLAHVLAALLSIAAVPVAQAQLRTVVGPSVVPLGGQLSITYSNDTNLFFGTESDYLVVRDQNGTVVYSDTTFEQTQTLGPYSAFSLYYNLKNAQGQPLPVGDYEAEVKIGGGDPSTFHPFRIANGVAGLVFEGTANINGPFPGTPSQRNFYLQSPRDAGALYFLLGSFTSSTGFPTCNGTFPLDPDSLFAQTLTPNSVFTNSIGNLNGLGRSKAPKFPLPASPSLVGIQVDAAFAVLDLSKPCPVVRISNVHTVTIFD